MTTSKDRIVPGTVVKVIRQKANNTRPFLILCKTPGGFMLDKSIQPSIGDHMTITKKPKLYTGINCVEVNYMESLWYAYYTNIRFDTTPV